MTVLVNFFAKIISEFILMGHIFLENKRMGLLRTRGSTQMQDSRRHILSKTIGPRGVVIPQDHSATLGADLNIQRNYRIFSLLAIILR